MICHSCGNEIPDDAVFCTVCGARQGDGPQPGGEPSDIPEQTAPAEPAAPMEPTAQPYPPTQPVASAQPYPTAQQVPPAQRQYVPYGQQNANGVPPYGQNPGNMPYGQQMPMNGAANGYGGMYAPPMQQQMRPPRKKTPLGAKIALILAVVLVAGFFIAQTVLRKQNDPKKTIDRFIEAVSAKDAAALREAVSVRDDALELSDEVARPFLTAYGGNERALEAFRAALDQERETLESGKETDGDGFLALLKEDHKVLGYALYSTYRVELTPMTVKLTSEFDGTEAKLDGTDYRVGEKATSVLLLPGVHKGTAAYTSPVSGAELKAEFTQTILPKGNDYGYSGAISVAPAESVGSATYDASSREMHIYFAYLTVGVRAEREETELKEILVDGKAFDVKNVRGTLSEGIQIGPLSRTAQEITVRTETCGFEQEDRFLPTETGDYQIVFTLSDEAKDAAAALAQAVLPDVIYAYYSFERQALNRLESAHAADFTPDALAAIRDHVDAWYRAAEATEDPTARTVYSNAQYTEDPEFADIRIEDGTVKLNVRLRGTLDGLKYSDYRSTEPDFTTSATFAFGVDLRHDKEGWVVTSTNW